MSKKIKIGILSFIIGTSLVSSFAFASPNDWRITYRNSDDTADISSEVPPALVNKFAVLGKRYEGGSGESGTAGSAWYYLKPGQLTVSPAASGYGASNYEVSLDLSNMNPMDLGNLSDLLDAKANVSSLALKSRAYEGTSLRNDAFTVYKNATVSSGIAVFHLTTDGTSSGTSLCPNGMIPDSINPVVSDATASFQMSWALSNFNKTITVTTNKLTTSNILTGILGQTAANGSVVKLSAVCY